MISDLVSTGQGTVVMMLRMWWIIYWERGTLTLRKHKCLYECCKTILIIKAIEFVQSWNAHNHKQKKNQSKYLIHSYYSYTCTTSWESKFYEQLKNANNHPHIQWSLLPALFQCWRAGTRQAVHNTARLKQQYTATTTCHIGFLSYKHTLWGLPPSLTLHHHTPALIPWLKRSWKHMLSSEWRESLTNSIYFYVGLYRILVWIQQFFKSKSEDRCGVCLDCWTNMIKRHLPGPDKMTF